MCRVDADCDHAVCVHLGGLQTGLMKQHEGGYMKGEALAQHGTLLWKCDEHLMTGLNVFSNFGVFTNVSQIQAWRHGMGTKSRLDFI